jgi:hypothetical protein
VERRAVTTEPKYFECENETRSDSVGALMETILIVIVALIFAGAALLAVDGAIQWIRRLIP